ncbi:MAG: hypothetical protein OK454_07405, partial [Thaumarchaeota archaeon]|nr:hypothetical protein [Nitrososphaerota archaeon]
DRLTGTGALERPPAKRRGRLDGIYPGVAIEWRQGLAYVSEWETGAPVDVGATRKKLDEVARETEEERAAKERRKKRKVIHRERVSKVKLSAKFINSDED